MDSKSRVRIGLDKRMQSYLLDCIEMHARRKQLFCQRWIGTDIFHTYLATIEQDSVLLEADMEDLIAVYFERGRNAFRNCDHKVTTDPAKERLSQLITKYIIQEKPEKSGFQIGVIELVRIHPFQLAQELGVRKAQPVGELNNLPKCLAFNGGIHLIPETEEWKSVTILWKMWKCSIERMPNEDFRRIPEYVNLHYRSPSHIDRSKCMEVLGVQPVCSSKVMPILRKAIKDHSGAPVPSKQEVRYCVETLYSSYSESIYNFYVKNTTFPTTRRKQIAATFSNRSVSSGNIIQSLRSLRKKQGPCPASEHTASTSFSEGRRTQQCGNPRTEARVTSCSAEKSQRLLPNIESLPGCLTRGTMVMPQNGIANSLHQRNHSNRSEKRLNGSEIGTSSAMSTCQTSQVGDSHLASCGSSEIRSASINSPARSLRMPTSVSSCHITKADAERRTQQDRNENSFSTSGFRRSGTVPKRSAPERMFKPLTSSGNVNQRVRNGAKTTPLVNPGKVYRDMDSELSSLSPKGRDTRPLAGKQPKKPKTKLFKV